MRAASQKRGDRVCEASRTGGYFRFRRATSASAPSAVSTSVPGSGTADTARLSSAKYAGVFLPNGPTSDEMERGRAQAEAHFMYRLQTIGGFGGKADQINGYFSETGNPDWFNEDLSRYRALSPSDIRAAAAAYLPLDKRVELIIEPEKKQ